LSKTQSKEENQWITFKKRTNEEFLYGALFISNFKMII